MNDPCNLLKLISMITMNMRTTYSDVSTWFVFLPYLQGTDAFLNEATMTYKYPVLKVSLHILPSHLWYNFYCFTKKTRQTLERDQHFDDFWYYHKLTD